MIQYLASIASSTVPSVAESSSSALARSGSEALAPAFGLPGLRASRAKKPPTLTSPRSQITALDCSNVKYYRLIRYWKHLVMLRLCETTNSSRFGSLSGYSFHHLEPLPGANIDWYLLEKSRVTARAEEREDSCVLSAVEWRHRSRLSGSASSRTSSDVADTIPRQATADWWTRSIRVPEEEPKTNRRRR